MFTPSWSRSSSLRLAITLAACCALMPLQSFAEGPARAVASTAIEGQYIVVLQDSNTDPAAFARRAGHTPLHVYRHAIKGYAARMSSRAVAALRRNPMVRFVQADQVVKANAQVLPDGINRANADTNTTAMIDGVDQRVDVDVAIIDTGIDPTHPDLNVVGGANFTKGKSSQWQDQNGHGTPRRRHGRRAR
jgi:subtilisin